ASTAPSRKPCTRATSTAPATSSGARALPTSSPAFPTARGTSITAAFTTSCLKRPQPESRQQPNSRALDDRGCSCYLERMKTIPCLFALLLAAAPAAADQVTESATGHKFDTERMVGGRPYQLLGTGVRSKFGFKAYAMGLYVDSAQAR